MATNTICGIDDRSEPTTQLPGTLGARLALWRQVTGGQGRLLAAVLAGAMAAFTTMSMVNLAVPGMVRQFHLAQGDVHWVASAYLLAMASALPAAPWLLQRWGVRACFGGATVVLMLAGALCAASTSFQGVLLGRLLQGVAAGLIQPVPLLMVQRCVAPAWRGRAAGAMGMGTALSIAFGPLFGGLLISWLGWQGVFALPVPLGLLSLALLGWDSRAARAGVTADAARTQHASTGGTAPAPRGLDWIGLVLASLATVALMQGLSLLAAGQGAVGALALTVSAVAGAGFAARQATLNAGALGHRVQALVAGALMVDGRYRLSCLAALFYGLVLNAFTYLLPLWLHDSLGLVESQMGMVLLVAGLATVVVQPLAASQVDLRPHWPVLGLGFGVLALSLLLLPMVGGWGLRQGQALALVGAGAAALCCRVGLAAAFAALFVPAQRALPAALQAQGAALAQLTQTLGGVLGIGLAALTLQWRTAAQSGAAGTSPDATGQTFLALSAVALLAAVITWRLRCPAVAPTAGEPPVAQ